MMSGYINKIKANVSIYATHKTSSVLDGSYLSVYMGRSLNFEDLREYVPGDNIKDIDWKASSRSGNLLIKRYVAEKKHNIMLVMDTGTKMEGDTLKGASKRETALMTAGTLSYLAYKNGDNVGALYDCDGMMKYHPFKSGLVNVENILAAYNADTMKTKKGNVERTLEYIINYFKRKMIIIVISDLKGIATISETTLKRLRIMHDVMCVEISDADVTGGKTFDLDTGLYMPLFITKNKKLEKMEREEKEALRRENERKLVHGGVMSVGIDDMEDTAGKIIELLEKHRYANNR